jgi:hypothetical protein
MQIEEDCPKCVNAVLIDIDEETYAAKRIVPLFYVDGKERVYGKEVL